MYSKQNQSKNPRMLEYGIGRSVWLKTETVVILHQQMRTVDIHYNQLLNRLRNCECTKNDHEQLLNRVVGSANCPIQTLDDPNWRDATIF